MYANLKIGAGLLSSYELEELIFEKDIVLNIKAIVTLAETYFKKGGE